MTHSPITQALVKARKAFNKAAKALPEYETLQMAQAAHEQRQTSVDRAQRLLRFILKWEPSDACSGPRAVPPGGDHSRL